MILFESILLVAIIIIISIFTTLKTTKALNQPSLLDKTDFKIMFLLTFLYSLVALYNLGSLNSPTGSWNAQNRNDTLTLNFNQPTKISAIYYYTGISNGKYHWDYLSDNLEPGIFDDSTARLGYPAHYKWNKFNPNTTNKVSQIQLVLDEPELEIKQIAIFDEQNHYINDIKVSSSNNSSTNNLIMPIEPNNYQDNYLSSTYFDEIFYATTAYQYLHKLNPYVAVHPPLGMLIIAIGILFCGMNAFGWRIMPALASIALVPLMYIFAKRLFGNRRSAVIASVIIMFEPMHYVMGKIAFLDGIVTFFILLEYYYLYSYLQLRQNGASINDCYTNILKMGIAFGIGISCKWSALYFTVPLLLSLLYGEIALAKPNIKQFLHSVIFLFVTLVVLPLSIYCLSYVPFIISQTDTELFSFIWRIQTYMYQFQAYGLANATHPYASNWLEWSTLKTPMSLFFWQDGTVANSIAFIAHPFIAFATFPILLFLIVISIKQRGKLQPWFLLIAICAQYLPYAFITHIMFIYYFYSTIPLLILGLLEIHNTLFDWNKPVHRYMTYLFLGLYIAIFIMFIPATSGIEFPRDYVVKYLLWRNGWNF